MWLQFQPSIRSGETAAVIVLAGGQLYVMGDKGMSSTLYHPLAFKPTEKIRDMISNKVPFLSISPAMLQDYDGDRLFFLFDSMRKSRPASRPVSS